MGFCKLYQKILCISNRLMLCWPPLPQPPFRAWLLHSAQTLSGKPSLPLNFYCIKAQLYSKPVPSMLCTSKGLVQLEGCAPWQHKSFKVSHLTCYFLKSKIRKGEEPGGEMKEGRDEKGRGAGGEMMHLQTSLHTHRTLILLSFAIILLSFLVKSSVYFFVTM